VPSAILQCPLPLLLLVVLLLTSYAPEAYVDTVINQGWGAGGVAANVPGAPLPSIPHQAAGSSSSDVQAEQQQQQQQQRQ
jgi:hypothetical protein